MQLTQECKQVHDAEKRHDSHVDLCHQAPLSCVRRANNLVGSKWHFGVTDIGRVATRAAVLFVHCCDLCWRTN